MFGVSVLAVPLVSMDIANTTAIQYVSTLLRWMTILIVILLPVIGRLPFFLSLVLDGDFNGCFSEPRS